MDPEIQELKEQIVKLTALTMETNEIVRGMRRSQRWRSFLQFVWWAVILVASGVAWYYTQPYIQKVEALYAGIGQTGSQAQTIEQQVASYIATHFGITPK